MSFGNFLNYSMYVSKLSEKCHQIVIDLNPNQW